MKLRNSTKGTVMLVRVKLGERVYEFEDSSDLSKARAIYMAGEHNLQEEFEEMLDNEGVKFTVDLFT